MEWGFGSGGFGEIWGFEDGLDELNRIWGRGMGNGFSFFCWRNLLVFSEYF